MPTPDSIPLLPGLVVAVILWLVYARQTLAERRRERRGTRDVGRRR